MASAAAAVPPPCVHFLRGACRFGARCRFRHDLAGPAEALPFHHREIAAAEGAGASTPHPPVRVMSYNVLADAYAQEHARELYSAVPWAALDWGVRAGLIAREVAHWAPDVVCLQEVDHYPHLARLLRPHGYSGAFTPRTGGRPDGLAMFWKRARFRAEAMRPLEFAPLGLKDNVAQVALLRGKGGNGGGAAPEPPALLVANIHVLFNPKRGDIKLGQVRTLLEAVAAAQAGRPASAVVCGDFNSAVGSPLYEFVLRGELELGPVDRRRLSGQVEVAGRTGWPAIRGAFLGALAAGAAGEAAAMEAAVSGSSIDAQEDSGAACEGGGGMRRADSAASTAGTSTSWASSRRSSAAKGPRPWSAEDLALAAGDPGAGVARHPLRLASAYHAVTGAEPLYTTVHDRYVGTVDYIFYGGGGEAGEGGLRPVRVLQPPSLASVPGGLPSAAWPSDHLCLVADFELS